MPPLENLLKIDRRHLLWRHELVFESTGPEVRNFLRVEQVCSRHPTRLIVLQCRFQLFDRRHDEPPWFCDQPAASLLWLAIRRVLPSEAPGATNVEMKWLTPTHLELTYKGHRTLDFQAVKCYGIDITVRAIPSGTSNAHTP